MRIAHLVLASFLAVTLVACDEEDGSTPDGSGAIPKPLCGDGVRVVEMESTTSAVLNEFTDTVDNWDGSCTPLVDSAGGPRKPGNDVVVRFVFPEDGTYRFSTEGSDFDTLLYALEDCNDGFTELACNDNAGNQQSGLSLFDRKAGEEAYIVVDSAGVKESKPFTLSAKKFAPNPPTIDEVSVYYNPVVEIVVINGEQVANGVIGIRATGTITERPLASFSLMVFGGAPAYAELFMTRWVYRFDEVEIFGVTQDDGSFVVEGRVGVQSLANALMEIGAIEIGVIDDHDVSSVVVNEAPVATPTVGRGESCDPTKAFNVCEGTDVCPEDTRVCTAT